MKNGAWGTENIKCCNRNKFLQASVKAGFSLTDLVVFSKIPSHCDVPHEIMHFQFKRFEIIPAMMHIWCFFTTEKVFFYKCPLWRRNLYAAKEKVACLLP